MFSAPVASAGVRGAGKVVVAGDPRLVGTVPAVVEAVIPRGAGGVQKIARWGGHAQIRYRAAADASHVGARMAVCAYSPRRASRLALARCAMACWAWARFVSWPSHKVRAGCWIALP